MINVVYSGNSAVFEGIMLSVLSMVKKTSQPIFCRILTMNLQDINPAYHPITNGQARLLERVMQEYGNADNRVVVLDMTALYREKLEGRNKNSEYTPYSHIRLLLDLLTDLPDKLIYLDVDTMLCRDVAELDEVDISQYEFGAALDYMGRVFIGRTYTNAGVLLLNMVEIKRSGLFERSRKLLQTKWMKLGDQSAINRCAKRKLILPMKFNEQRAIKQDTVVKHFCKGIRFFPLFYIYNYKQWNREKVHKKLKIHDFDDVYELFDQIIKVDAPKQIADASVERVKEVENVCG